MKIAVAGKGGVGKTLIAGVLSRFFSRRGHPVIAIDADPSPNLALTLGVPREKAKEIVPISENEALIRLKTETGYGGLYRLNFTVEDVVRDYAIPTPAGVPLLVMGTVRAMGTGCMCPANALVRALLRHLLVERGEAVIMDMEAGLEHLGRGTIEGVDLVLIVSDAALRALETARSIHQLSTERGTRSALLIGNRVRSGEERERVQSFAKGAGMELLGFIPFDPRVADADVRGESVLELSDAPAIVAIESLAGEIISRYMG